MISSYYIRGEACNLDDGRGIAEDEDGPHTSLVVTPKWLGRVDAYGV